MSERNYENMTRKQLSQLPERDWKEVSEYDTILVFWNWMKHETWYGCFTVIGCREWNAVEIIAKYSDHIQFQFNNVHRMNVDSLFKSRITRYHSNKFIVWNTLSSVYIQVYPM